MRAADGVHSSLHKVPRASANNGCVQQRMHCPPKAPKQLPRGNTASPPPNPQRIPTRPHHPAGNWCASIPPLFGVSGAAGSSLPPWHVRAWCSPTPPAALAGRQPGRGAGQGRRLRGGAPPPPPAAACRAVRCIAWGRWGAGGPWRCGSLHRCCALHSPGRSHAITHHRGALHEAFSLSLTSWQRTRARPGPRGPACAAAARHWHHSSDAKPASACLAAPAVWAMHRVHL